MRWCPERKRMVALHRLVVEAEIGRHLGRYEYVMHACDNGACVALDHLVVGTNALNMQDCVAKGRSHQTMKTHCPHGHEYTPENTLVVTATGHRQCRICNRARNSAWRTRTALLT